MTVDSSREVNVRTLRLIGKSRRRQWRIVAVLCASLLAAPASFGAEYSWQLSGRAQRLEIGDSYDNDRAAVDGVYYFVKVDDSKGPRELAAFLNRSSRVSASVHREHETETNTVIPLFGAGAPLTFSTVTKTQGYSIAGRYVRPTTGWYAGAGYDNASTDFPSSPPLSEKVELEGYNLLVGKYFGRSTTLEATWNSTRSTMKISLPECPAPNFCSGPSGFKTTSDETGLAAFHVGGAGRLRYSVEGRIASTRSDLRFEAAAPSLRIPAPGSGAPPVPGFSGPPLPGGSGPPVRVVGPIFISEPEVNPPDFGPFRTYSAAGELFPTDRLGVRLGYTRWDGDRLRDEGYDVSTTWFFTNRVAVSFAFGRTNRKQVISGVDSEDTATVQVIGRF